MVRSIAAVLGPACGMALSVACCLQGTPRAAAAPHLLNPSLSLKQVEAAQQAWCQALLQISADYERGGLAKAKATASAVIDQSYAYQYGPVAFKPTLASGQQTFRPTRAGALAYFVGHDPAFPGDSGFALKGWRGCKVDNEVVQLRGTLAITMGKVILTDAKGKTTTVDKTWVFEREPDGTIRIVVHHSSLPFSG